MKTKKEIKSKISEYNAWSPEIEQRIIENEKSTQELLKRNEDNFKKAKERQRIAAEIERENAERINSASAKKDYSNVIYILLQFIVFFLIIFYFYNYNTWREQIYNWELSTNRDLSSIFRIRGLYDISCLIPLYLLIKNRVFLGIAGIFYSSDENGIENAKDYRRAKLSTMGQEKASEEYMKTAWIDSLDNKGEDKETKRVKNYVNSKLNSMQREDGYNWLKK